MVPDIDAVQRKFDRIPTNSESLRTNITRRSVRIETLSEIRNEAGARLGFDGHGGHQCCEPQQCDRCKPNLIPNPQSGTGRRMRRAPQDLRSGAATTPTFGAGTGRFDWLTARSLKAAHAFRIVRETGESVLDGFSRGTARFCLDAMFICRSSIVLLLFFLIRIKRTLTQRKNSSVTLGFLFLTSRYSNLYSTVIVMTSEATVDCAEVACVGAVHVISMLLLPVAVATTLLTALSCAWAGAASPLAPAPQLGEPQV